MLARHIKGEHISSSVQHHWAPSSMVIFQPCGSVEKHIRRLLLGMAGYLQVMQGMRARFGADLLSAQWRGKSKCKLGARQDS